METEGDKVLGKKPKTIMRHRGKRQDDEQLETGGGIHSRDQRWGISPERDLEVA